MVRRVEDRGDELEVLPVLERIEERRDRKGLASHDPVLVAPADPDLAEPQLLDPGTYLRGSVRAAGRPRDRGAR